MTKRILTCLLAILMILSVMLFAVSCGEDNRDDNKKNPDDQGGGDIDRSTWTVAYVQEQVTQAMAEKKALSLTVKYKLTNPLTSLDPTEGEAVVRLDLTGEKPKASIEIPMTENGENRVYRAFLIDGKLYTNYYGNDAPDGTHYDVIDLESIWNGEAENVPEQIKVAVAQLKRILSEGNNPGGQLNDLIGGLGLDSVPEPVLSVEGGIFLSVGVDLAGKMNAVLNTVNEIADKEVGEVVWNLLKLNPGDAEYSANACLEALIARVESITLNQALDLAAGELKKKGMTLDEVISMFNAIVAGQDQENPIRIPEEKVLREQYGEMNPFEAFLAIGNSMTDKDHQETIESLMAVIREIGGQVLSLTIRDIPLTKDPVTGTPTMTVGMILDMMEGLSVKEASANFKVSIHDDFTVAGAESAVTVSIGIPKSLQDMIAAANPLFKAESLTIKAEVSLTISYDSVTIALPDNAVVNTAAE